MPLDQSLLAARATANMVLTTIAHGFVQPEYVMKLLFPLVETTTYGGVTIQFDSSVYEDVSDDRADDTPYPVVQTGYEGKPYKLNTKGLSYRVPDKRRREMENLRINWDQHATETLVGRGGLRHEIESATVAGTAANYASTHTQALTSGSYLNSVGFDPDPLIRSAKTTVAQTIGVSPNVMILDELSFDALASTYANNFTSTGTTPGLRQQLTEDTLAAIYGFSRVRIARALKKTPSGLVPILNKKIIIAYTNPAALNADRMAYRPNGNINQFSASMGYTYVMQGNPLMYNPYYDENRGATVYKMDFDRSVQATGVNASGLINHAYLITNTLA